MPARSARGYAESHKERPSSRMPPRVPQSLEKLFLTSRATPYPEKLFLNSRATTKSPRVSPLNMEKLFFADPRGDCDGDGDGVTCYQQIPRFARTTLRRKEVLFSHSVRFHS